MPFSEHHHRSLRRIRIARLYLLLIAIALVGANALLWFYVQHPMNQWPILAGQIIGSVLASIVLLFALWRRQSWARYTLIVVLWFVAAVFTWALMVALNRQHGVERRPALAVIGAVALYVGANVLLIRSRKIHYLAQPAGSGG